jgi:Transposase DDE domain
MKNKLMPFADKLLLRKRGTIESVIGIMKQQFSIEHTRHRSSLNFLSHILSTITTYFFKQYKPSTTSFINSVSRTGVI